jgi:hypothetical protein
MIEARYRSDYAGEFVVLETRWSGNKKHQEREWIDNPITNQHISHRAAVISHNIDRDTFFDYRRLAKHRGGLLGSKKLQTYGTGDIAREMSLDFAVELDSNKLQQLLEVEYNKTNVVYTTAKNCIRFMGEFYLIPYMPRLMTEVMPAYIAAFDGHEEIFLIGFNNDTPFVDNRWPDQLLEVALAYKTTKFYLIGERTNMPQKLFDLPNVDSLSYRKFVVHCDV